MRVFILGSYAPSLINFRGPLIRAMVAQGHSVIAAAPDMDNRTARDLQALGARPLSVPLNRRGMNPLRDLASVGELVRVLRREAPDVMLSYTIKPSVYGSVAARFAGVPRIHAMVEGAGYAFSGTGLRRTLLATVAGGLYRLGLGVCHSVFFLNEDNRQFFLTHRLISASQRTCLLNGTGIDLAHYAPVPLPPEYAERPVFLCIARLLREKGVAIFAEAARLAQADFPHAVFRLVGPADAGADSIPREEVDAWRQWLDIPGPVDDVRPDIACCAVYVLPSFHEGVPRTTLEAMSMGRAVLTTNAVGCRETVRPGPNGFSGFHNHADQMDTVAPVYQTGQTDQMGQMGQISQMGENGIMVPVGDAPALANAMRFLLRNPERIANMGAASRRYAEDRFDVHAVNAVMLREMGLLEEVTPPPIPRIGED